jgi:NADH:ubiquinone oxidoreductase subunit F (NADH-binding)
VAHRAREPAPRLMAVNIDEGEPGTFKDRWYLERDPHRFLEGLLSRPGPSGVRRLHLPARRVPRLPRHAAGRTGALQRRAGAGGCRRIELRRGAGAYICGEESAMIESIEGKRGLPRLRPPYVAQVGLFGRPTLEHNFETLFWVRDIVERGADWFADQGRHGRQGCAASRSAAACASRASSWRRPASRCANWSTNTAAACCPATR